MLQSAKCGATVVLVDNSLCSVCRDNENMSFEPDVGENRV